MASNSWREDMAKLEQEIAKAATVVAADLGSMSALERNARVAMLLNGLKKEGIEIGAGDEEIIQRFAEGKNTFDELTEHFHERLLAASKR